MEELPKPQKDLPLPEKDLPLPEKEIPPQVKGKLKLNPRWLVLGLVVLALIIAGAAASYYYLNSNKQVACTLEAKICPDGSSVGRTGPKCEFSKCSTSNATDATANWKTITDNYGFTIKFPDDFVTQEMKCGLDGCFATDIKSDENIPYIANSTQSIKNYPQNLSNNEIVIAPSYSSWNPPDIEKHTKEEVLERAVNNFAGSKKWVNPNVIVPWVNANTGQSYTGQKSWAYANFTSLTLDHHKAVKFISNNAVCYKILEKILQYEAFYLDLCAYPKSSKFISTFDKMMTTFKFTDSTNIPTPTCRPRPACLDSEPRCMIQETDDMCPPKVNTVIYGNDGPWKSYKFSGLSISVPGSWVKNSTDALINYDITTAPGREFDTTLDKGLLKVEIYEEESALGIQDYLTESREGKTGLLYTPKNPINTIIDGQPAIKDESAVYVKNLSNTTVFGIFFGLDFNNYHDLENQIISTIKLTQ